MNTNVSNFEVGQNISRRPVNIGPRTLLGSAGAFVALAVAVMIRSYAHSATSTPAAALPSVAVSSQLQRNLDAQLGFMGQLSKRT
jgi:hypothetical protein